MYAGDTKSAVITPRDIDLVNVATGIYNFRTHRGQRVVDIPFFLRSKEIILLRNVKYIFLICAFVIPANCEGGIYANRGNVGY